MQTLFPSLRYVDAPGAIEFLKRAFGFEEHMVVPGAENSIAHAQLQLGGAMIMLGSARDDGWPSFSPMQIGGKASGGIYIVVDDVDAAYERAKAAGADIFRELEDTEYGSREFAARDPEGHLWSLGTYQPHGA